MSEEKPEPSWNGWMIERGDAAAPLYLAINPEGDNSHGVEWVADPYVAMQFRRKHDATIAQVALVDVTESTRVAEHAFGGGPYQGAPDPWEE